MKKWIKKIGQNKFQFFFFVGILSLLVVSLIIAASSNPNTDKPGPGYVDPPVVDPTDPTDNKPVEKIALPFDEEVSYSIVRKFYDKNASKEEQELSLIKYMNSYRTSVGTSYAMSDGTSFDVTSALSGKVIEIKESPLYGNYVVLEHDNGVKTYYYGLSEVTVVKGTDIAQGDKIGVSGTTEIDKEAGNHIYFQVTKNGKHLNPEKTIGRTTAAI